MGFSVSGSTAIVFVGVFIALGMLQPAVSNGLERVTDARSDTAERLLDQQNTAVDLTAATYYAGNSTVRVRAVNAGTSALSVEDTDVLLDNAYVVPSATAVDGDAATDVWLPGETLAVGLDVGENPTDDRLTITVDHGVSDAEVVA
ncbi:flagellin [Halobium palmae]|uniref:Flagellin n=1 Tax=Halobium palmae TaxID=1776492 RepID=A0ABD5RXX9_9EURY